MLNRKYPFFFALLALVSLSTAGANAADHSEFDHSEFDRLLSEHVVWVEQGHTSEVDYASLRQDRPVLTGYLGRLADVSGQTFDSWPESAQLAFLINAYNAGTLELILTEYPDLESIRELGSLFRSPWKREFVSLLDDVRSLDNIEHDLIRGSGRYNEPRIHFAVNCASIGCPALRDEAYTMTKLDAQLEDQTRRFLSDRSRNRLSGSQLEVSSIFKWYREDFETGWNGADSLAGFLTLYATPLSLNSDEVDQVKSQAIEIDFLDYDWALNDFN